MIQTIEQQIAELGKRYGTPRHFNVTLDATNYEPLTMDDRYGEVCMVVRRANGRLLTATKTFYPPGAHRLLTGGIHHGERIEDALVRELYEETGLETAIRQFLAVVAYTNAPPFASYAFLVDEIGGTLGATDPDEQVAAFHEIGVEDLPERIAALEGLDGTNREQGIGSWRAWGHFRAAVHRAVYQMLRDEQ